MELEISTSAHACFDLEGKIELEEPGIAGRSYDTRIRGHQNE